MGVFRLVGVEEDPRVPGYGWGTWEDGTKNPAPMSVLNDALAKQEQELNADRQSQRTAQAPQLTLTRAGENQPKTEPTASDAVRLPPGRINPDQFVDPNAQASVRHPNGVEWTSHGQQQPQQQNVAQPVSDMQPGQQPPQEQPLSSRAQQANNLAGDAYMAALQRGRYVPGRAAVTPETAAARFAMPEQQVTETSGAVPFDEEYHNQVLAMQRQAKETEGLAMVKGAEANLAQNQYLASQAQDELRQRQVDVAQAEQRWRSRYTQLQSTGRALAERKIDPTRVWSSTPVWSRVMLMVGAALSSAGGNNTWSQMIQQTVNDDVEDQLRQLGQEKGENRDQLRALQEQWGGLDGLRDAMRLQRLEAIKATAGVMAAKAGTQNAQLNRDALLQAADAAGASSIEAMRARALGEVSQRRVDRMVSPQAGSSGGYVPYTPEQVAGLASKAADAYSNGDKAMGDALKLRMELQQARTGEIDPNSSAGLALAKRQETYGTAMSDLSDLDTVVGDIISQAGITVDNAGQAHHEGIPGIGMAQNVAKLVGGDQLASVISSEKGRNIRRMALDVLLRRINQLSGAAFSQRERENHEQVLSQAWTQGEQQFAQAIVDYQRTLKNREEALAGAAGPEAVQRYEEARSAFARRKQQQSSGIVGEVR
jgi:hypothetical protein